MRTIVHPLAPFGIAHFGYKIPLFLESIHAGFPSPAEDFIDSRLDLNEYLIEHPAATYFVRVSGDAMKDAGIFSGSILIVDKSLDPSDNAIVIAVLNGEMTVRRYKKERDAIWLFAENKDYPPICVRSEMQFEVWGVVKSVITPIS